jgi:hypothetical protein
LAIGISGHRNVGVDGPVANAVAAALDEMVARLTHAVAEAIARGPQFFSGGTPVLRLVGMAADGADLLAARAARTHSCEIACVLPFPVEEYRKDFETPAARELLDSILSGAASILVLPGTRADGPRAYERANGIILANVDLLVAVWDGKRAPERAGTGDVVQAAFARGLPILIIDPAQPATPILLARPVGDTLESATAIDIDSEPLPADLTDIVAKIMLPPRSSAMREGLADLMEEKPKRRNIRVEYLLLLAALSPTPDAKPVGKLASRADSATQWPGRLSELGPLVAWLSGLADYYGQLFRSSATTEFLVIIVSAFVSSIVMLAFPDVTGASVVVQSAIGALVLLDVAYRSQRRWHERWLDYRLIAERLRCLRFLRPLGLALEPAVATAGPASWVDWYIRRTERSTGAPSGVLAPQTIEAARQQLLERDIAEQLAYHRRAFGQLGLLERRLAQLTAIAGLMTLAVAAAFGIWAARVGGFDAVQWRPYAIVLLFVLPAAITAFNGFRADADLVRLVERSAMTSMTLGRLQRSIRAATPDYDRVAVAAARTADIMGQELSEWRFVLASRRARTRHRKTLGRGHFSHDLRRRIKRLGLAKPRLSRTP